MGKQLLSKVRLPARLRRGALCALGVGACSPTPSATGDGDTTSVSAPTTEDPSGDGASSGDGDGSGGRTTTTDPDGSGGRDYPDVEFTYDPSKDEQPETCVEKTISTEPLPLDMFIVLDRTGSMGADCTFAPDGALAVDSKWCKAITALGQYFTSAAAMGHRAALQFMIPAATQSTDCTTASTNLHTQAEVDLTTLPDAPNGALIAALDAAIPDATSTAIESALNGITVYTEAHRTEGRQMIGILISDGDPSFCSDSLSTLAGIGRRHFEGTGIPIFIMGMTGAAADTLEALAEEAGSPEHSEHCDPSDSNPSCHYWSVGDGEPAAFVAALDAIQETAVGCAFAVPSMQDGLVKLDTARVTLSDGGPDLLELSLTEHQACGSHHYTINELDGKPTIVLCPETCDLLADTARVDITIECYGN